MTKATHSPGPWSVLRADWDESGNARYTLDGIKTIGALDARLIAQAPKLLEDLIYLRDCAESGELPSPERWAQVQAVIKQATGKTP